MEDKKFPYSKTFIIGFGFFGISIIWPLFNSFVPIFLQEEFMLGPTMAFFVMTWDNIINVFFQPWVGAKSDKTWNRFGRRKGWIILGAPIAAAAFVMIPLANTVAAIMVYILITNLGMALFRSPTVAWLGDLFVSEERSKANGIINLMGGVGGAIAFLGGGTIYDSLGRAAPFAAGAGLMLVALSVAIVKVKEPERIQANDNDDESSTVWENIKTVFSAENKSGGYVLLGILFWFMAFGAVETGVTSFSVFSLGMTPGQATIMVALFSGSFILFALPSGLIATRIGRKRTINIGLIGLIIVFGLGFFLINSRTMLSVALVLGGILWSFINVNSLPLVYDYGDESKIGAYTGMYYFSSQSAAILGPVLSGFVVESFGNDFRMLWAFGAIFMVLAWAVMQRVTD